MNEKKKRKRRIIVIIIIIILLLLLGICFFILYKKPKTTSIGFSDNEVDAQTPNLSSKANDDYFEIVGFGQLEISKDNPNVNLINSSENNVYLSFDVFYNDELLYSSKLISPGKMEQYNVYSNLNAGQYTLTYSINVYDINENVLWSGIQQEQEILIRG